jgi:hypothetical protein
MGGCIKRNDFPFIENQDAIAVFGLFECVSRQHHARVLGLTEFEQITPEVKACADVESRGRLV